MDGTHEGCRRRHANSVRFQLFVLWLLGVCVCVSACGFNAICRKREFNVKCVAWET